MADVTVVVDVTVQLTVVVSSPVSSEADLKQAVDGVLADMDYEFTYKDKGAAITDTLILDCGEPRIR